jgi:predicted small lipoprotein YifL
VSRSDRPVLRAACMGALALVLGLALSGCGRRGPMDAPPGASSVVEQPAEIQVDPQGRPLAPAGQKRRLPIDWLLD